MKMRTHHIEAVLLFIENAAEEDAEMVQVGEDSWFPMSLIKEARGEVSRLDQMIDMLHLANQTLRINGHQK